MSDSPAFNGHAPCPVRQIRLIGWMLAAAVLCGLPGCATRPPATAPATTASPTLPHTLPPSREAGAPAAQANPASILRPLGAATAMQRPCRAHEPTPSELSKQRSAIDPLRVPAVYTELFYDPRRESLTALNADGLLLRPYQQFDDGDSGLSGYVLKDDASGHALMLFKGMDRPFAERDGWGGVLTDLGGVLAAKFGTGNAQLRLADDLYTEVLCDEAIRSIELVGYSMGSPIANYLAVKYGAYAVVFGDMGLDATLLKRHAHGDLPAARALARSHVVSLALNGDVLVKVFGVGDVVGSVVKLPGVLVGVLHQPEVYANAANAAMRERDAAANKAMHAQASSTIGEPTGSGTDANDRGERLVDAHSAAAQH